GRQSRELGQALDTAGLSRAAKLFAGLTRLDPSVAKWQELLDGAFAHVTELAQAARDYAAAIESDPQRLGAVEQRRDVLFRLSQGAEDVTFEVQLNVGLEARPLAKVASGGELSRLMLALKVVLAEHDAVPTLVFDEVDQGIGGEVGARVGEALATVSRAAPEGRQALVITHLPQIGAYADHHVVVAKGARGGIATSDVQVVTGEARTRELARMLGDPDMRTALGHAAELLRKASVSPAAPGDRPSPRGRAQRR